MKKPAIAAKSLLPERFFVILLPLLIFCAASAGGRIFAALMALVAFVLGIGRGVLANLAERSTALTGAVLLYGSVALISGLWCHFGGYAVLESAKMLTALSLFGLLLLRWPEKLSWSGLLAVLTAVLAVFALLTLDAGGLRLLSRVYEALKQYVLAMGFDAATTGYETGIRITGVFSNANVTGGILGPGLLLCLWQWSCAEAKKKRVLFALALGTEALAFFLSFSMGAMASFALGCVVYLVLQPKGEKLTLFLRMLLCIVVTLLCAAVSTPLLGKGAAAALIVVLGPLSGLIIDLVDARLLPALGTFFSKAQKAGYAAAAALVVLIALYGVLALHLTGPAVLDAQGPALERALKLPGGAYTVSEISPAVSPEVRITSQNQAELMMHTDTLLYEGTLDSAAFTVPDDSSVVWFSFTGDCTLDKVTLSNGVSVPLGYRLLPTFAANRLQALWANQNFIQRLVFFEDGLKLFTSSPLIGWGLGGVEGQLTSVQRFYYESKYIHNQPIQIMAEAGVIGLAAFALLWIALAMTLFRIRKLISDKSLPAALWGIFALVALHSCVEVVWSTCVYPTLLFTLFAALSMLLRELEPAQKSSNKLVSIEFIVSRAVCLFFALLIAGNVIAAQHYASLEPESSEEVISAMSLCDRLDVYDDSLYKTMLMANLLQTEGANDRSFNLAQELARRANFDDSYYAAAYYYLPMGDVTRFTHVMRTGLAQERSNPDAWNSALDLYSQAYPNLPEEQLGYFVAGVCAIADDMSEANAYLMAPITLDTENEALVNACSSLEGRDEGTINAALSLVIDS